MGVVAPILAKNGIVLQPIASYFSPPCAAQARRSAAVDCYKNKNKNKDKNIVTRIADTLNPKSFFYRACWFVDVVVRII